MTRSEDDSDLLGTEAVSLAAAAGGTSKCSVSVHSDRHMTDDVGELSLCADQARSQWTRHVSFIVVANEELLSSCSELQTLHKA